MTGSETKGRRAQRRHLTALFSDLSDSTALASSVDPEEFAELLEQLNRTFEQIIHRHGGTILQVRGDGVFAVFGLEAREDEGRRATQAALDLHQAVKNITFTSPLPGFSRLTLHTGIHSGLVLAVEGDEVLGRLVLVGDAANLASRLSDLAGADEILVTEASLGAERHFFETGECRSLCFDGIDEALTVYPVLGRAAVDTRFAARTLGTRIPLVGRERELSVLRRAFEASARGQAQAVSIVAPPGVGKTRLVDEFLNGLEDRHCRVLRTYCESYLNAEPLQPLLQLLRQLLGLPRPVSGQLPVDGASIAERLAALAPELASEAPTVEAILSAGAANARPSDAVVGDLCLRMAGALGVQAPVVLFIDDWQWADDATRAMLRHSSESARLKILLIRASREQLPGEAASATIHLEPLDASHAISMIETLLPTADRVVVEQVRRASGGNPLFIEELCHAVNRGAQIPTLEESWQSAQVSNHLNMLIASRVAQLSGSQLELLRVLAVMGNVVPGWLLDSVVDVTGMRGAIDQLAELDLLGALEADGSIRFRHGITRDVVLDSLNRYERQALHLEVAQVIEARFPADEREPLLETLAYHYGETREYERAADYAEAAGDKALAASAMDRARQQFQAALRALDRMNAEAVYERWMSIAKRLAMACLFDAEPAQCAIYRRAIDLARARNDRANQADGEYWLAYVNYALGEALEAKTHIDRARALVEEIGGKAFKTQVLATWGQIRATACEYADAVQALNEAMSRQAPYRNRPGMMHAYAYSLAAKGMVLGDQGCFDAAFACFDEAQALIEGPIHPTHGSITSMRTAVYLWQGRWEEARLAARANVEIGERMGSRYITAMGTALGCYARWQLDRDTPIDDMVRALAWVEGTHQAIWTSLHFSWLCEMLAELGRHQEARRAAVWVLKRARKLERLGESVAYCALASIPATPSTAGAPERCFARARASAEVRESPRELALIDLKEARWLAAAGDAQGAAQALEGCRDAFSGMGMYTYAAQAQRLERSLARG
jgi:class 3 adenylate cyclase/tetratricopeptide (TPR) repeat protein